MTTTLIRDGYVLSSRGWLSPGYVILDGPIIKAVGNGNPPENLNIDETVTANNCAVIPGLLNAHTHLSQTFMRGLGGGLTLMRWLKERIWPLQSAMTVQETHLAALLGLVENLRCGATKVVDHHKITTSSAHTDVVCEAAQQVGIRFTLARGWVDRGANAEPADLILEEMDRLFNLWHRKTNLIEVASGPLATWRVSEDLLQKTHDLCKIHGAMTHIHVSETQDEIKMCLDETNLRPIAWLNSLGILDEYSHIVHAVWIDENEIATLAEKKSTVVHCPVSNAVLASGIAPVTALRQHGVNVVLGSDGPASGDTQDMWEIVKSALLFARVSTLDAMAISPADVLNMALCVAGLAQGLPADIIVIDLNNPRAMPVHDPVSALTLCTHGSDVDTVFVNGQILMKNKKILCLDEEALLAECMEVSNFLCERAGLCL